MNCALMYLPFKYVTKNDQMRWGKLDWKTSILLSRNAPFSIGPMGEMTDESRFGETYHMGKGLARLSTTNEIKQVKICEVFTFWYF